jgi:hypothetical protein
MAAEALPTRRGGGHGSGNVHPGIKIFQKIVDISLQRRGILFCIRYQGFSPISLVGKHFLQSTMVKSTLWVARKIPILLMIFFVNRDALYNRDNLFPSKFFCSAGGEVREKVEGQQYTSIVTSSMGATVHKLGRKYQPWVNVSPVYKIC